MPVFRHHIPVPATDFPHKPVGSQKTDQGGRPRRAAAGDRAAVAPSAKAQDGGAVGSHHPETDEHGKAANGRAKFFCGLDFSDFHAIRGY